MKFCFAFLLMVATICSAFAKDNDQVIHDSSTLLTINDVNASTQGADQPTMMSVYFKADQSTSNVCSKQQGQASNCLCQFAWTEVIGYGPQAQSVSHLEYTAVNQIISGGVVCSFPRYRMTEVPEDTTIGISVVSTTNIQESFVDQAYAYTVITKPYFPKTN